MFHAARLACLETLSGHPSVEVDLSHRFLLFFAGGRSLSSNSWSKLELGDIRWVSIITRSYIQIKLRKSRLFKVLELDLDQSC